MHERRSCTSVNYTSTNDRDSPSLSFVRPNQTAKHRCRVDSRTVWIGEIWISCTGRLLTCNSIVRHGTGLNGATKSFVLREHLILGISCLKTSSLFCTLSFCQNDNDASRRTCKRGVGRVPKTTV